MKVAEAIRDVDMTPIQAVHLLATTLTDYTRRFEAHEMREIDAKESAVPAQVTSHTMICKVSGSEPLSNR